MNVYRLRRGIVLSLKDVLRESFKHVRSHSQVFSIGFKWLEGLNMSLYVKIGDFSVKIYVLLKLDRSGHFSRSIRTLWRIDPIRLVRFTG